MSSDLHDKMFNHEATPPGEVWEKLAAELDDAGIGKKFTSRLTNLEVLPPPAAWDAIQKTLDREKTAPVPVIKILSPFFKYAAAAVIISFVIWGGFQLSNKKIKKGEVAIKETLPGKKEESIFPLNGDTIKIAGNSTAIPDNTAREEQDARDNAALEKSKGTYAKLDLTTNSRLRNVSNFYFSSNASLISGTKEFTNDQNPGDDVDMADRYIMLMTPDGNIIRVSKKLSDLVCCVSGEAQDKNCLDQLKKWQQKMANSAVGQSSGNFMDIFNLVNTLQGNED